MADAPLEAALEVDVPVVAMKPSALLYPDATVDVVPRGDMAFSMADGAY